MCKYVQESAGMQEQLQGWVSAMEEKEGKEAKIKYSKEILPKWNGLGRLSSGTKKLGKQWSDRSWQVQASRQKTASKRALNSKDGRYEHNNTECSGQHSGVLWLAVTELGPTSGH